MKILFRIICGVLMNFLFLNICLAQMKTCECPIISKKECSQFYNLTSVISATNCISSPLILVFEDDFEKNSINNDNWIVYDENNNFPHQAVPRDPTFSGSKQWYKKENVIIEDGKLKIIAKRETITNKTFSSWDGAANGGQGGMVNIGPNDFNFTSGEIDTKWEFGYGIYEIMCKLPDAGKGWYPAFWTYSDAANKWNEIDIFEFWSSANENNDYRLIEFTATNHATWLGNHTMCASHINQSIDFSNGFHKFTLHFLPHVLRWYVDGWLVKEIYKNYKEGSGGAFYPMNCGNNPNDVAVFLRDKNFPFGPMNIKMNLAIEPGAEAPNADTPFPNSFEIEYIKIYQFVPCSNDIVNINSQSQLEALLSTQSNYYNVIFGRVINIDNCTLKTNRSLRLIGTEEINFGINFNTETGSYLESSIGACQSTSLYKQRVSPDLNNSDILNEFDNNQFMVKNHETHNIKTNDNFNSEVINNPISISPNPISLKNGLLSLNLFENDISEVSIISSSGQIIIDKLNILEPVFQIKSELFKTSGIYYISIKGKINIKTYHFKLIVL